LTEAAAGISRERLRTPARSRGLSMNQLIEAMSTQAIATFDALDHPPGPDVIGPVTGAATGLVPLRPGSSDADPPGAALWERYRGAG
jgi:hypothetical protein